MSGLYPIAGSKIFIGAKVTPKGNVTLADFAAAPWVEIGGWVNAGGIGDTQNVGEQDLINERRTRKYKTTRNAGTQENQFVPMAQDPGQIAFKAAIDDCSTYQFKIEWGADCTPSLNVTISNGDPAVITWANHGLLAGQPVVFSTTGALRTKAVGLTSARISVSATLLRAFATGS